MPTLERVADGRVFTGRQGVALKLVDELGDERTALAWLAKEKNIDPKTPVRDYRLRDRLERFAVPAHGGDRDASKRRAWARSRGASRGLGRRCRRIERLSLDGLLAFGTLRLRTNRRATDRAAARPAGRQHR